jgi:hypothetical protein
VANFGVKGPYCFTDEDGRAVIVTSARYVEMLWIFIAPELSLVELSSRPYGSSKIVQMLIQREHPYGGRSGNISDARCFIARRVFMACNFA